MAVHRLIIEQTGGKATAGGGIQEFQEFEEFTESGLADVGVSQAVESLVQALDFRFEQSAQIVNATVLLGIYFQNRRINYLRDSIGRLRREFKNSRNLCEPNGHWHVFIG